MGKSREVVYTIKEAAGILHLHEQTLRNWERAGVIKLRRIGRNRSRLFSHDDIDRCRWIKKYAGRGVSLRGVKTILSLNHRQGAPS